jgi:hypothetical protein
MSNPQKCEQLAAAIDDLLKEGLTADENVIHFIESTFFDSTLPHLLEIVTDQESGESQALIDLLFFPDERFQCRLEHILEAGTYSVDDKKQVVALLEENPPATRVRFADSGWTLPLVMSADIVAQFVERLHITRQPDGHLQAGINDRFQEPQRSMLKVKLRNARFEYATNVKRFLLDFLNKIPQAGGRLLEYMDYIVDFLSEVDPEEDIYSALVVRKQGYFKSLRAAAKFQQQLGGHNMETLMLKGVRSPAMGIEEARDRMALIDAICQAVFGKTAYFHADQQRMNLDGGSADVDVLRAINLLS